MKSGAETVGREAGFLLDRIRRRPRPRNRQTRKSLGQAGHEEGVLDLRANGSGSIDKEVDHVMIGARSTATRGIARPSSPEKCPRPRARTICAQGFDLHTHRGDPHNEAAASSMAVIDFDLGSV